MGWLVVVLLLGGILLHVTDLVLFLLFPPLVLCLACDRGALGRFFAWGPIFQSGVLSYAIYVLHNVLIGPLNWARIVLPLQMPHWVAESVIAFCFVVSLFGVAMAAHRWVEYRDAAWSGDWATGCSGHAATPVSVVDEGRFDLAELDAEFVPQARFIMIFGATIHCQSSKSSVWFEPLLARSKV